MDEDYEITYANDCFVTVIPPFKQTTYKTIVLEITENQYASSNTNKIDFNSMAQLIRVLNYAHDQGSRRVILVNQTNYSAEVLLEQIKTELPNAEKERTGSRLVLLLCETEKSIFNCDEFRGHSEIPPRYS